MRAVRDPEEVVVRARTVVDRFLGETRVIGGALRARVEPEMRYWDCASGVMVSRPIVSGGAPVVAEGRREVLVGPP